ncbi:ABC1 kinase family protein [Psychromicrobium sp. YIM B11713]|uniref:ABC1 kinase family protein n=1 Tax=Psychromicrobium sp. YIM B11713 TaxID=3145233 RepID=UPI00374F0FFE
MDIATLLSLPLILFFTLLFAVIAAFVARRILGVPVGWPRSILIGLAVNFGATPLINIFLTASGLTAESILQPQNLGGALLLIVLSFAWAFAFGVALLVVSEVLWPTGSVPSPVAFLRARRASKARRRRYFQVAGIALRAGLLRPTGAKALQSGTLEAARTAKALASTLNKSGVAFIKLGQMMSTRADLLPAEYISELSALQTRATPEEWTALEPEITTAFGAPWPAVLSSISTEPLASASVAQVHTGVLLSGEPVVVKVQRPAALAQVKVDLDIIERFARLLERSTSWGKTIGVAALASGFAASLREELDYRIELDNMLAVAAGSSSLRIPRVFPALSSRQVLVMEQLAGVPLGDAENHLTALSEAERHGLAQSLLTGILQQIVVTGVFHADLHPGNIIFLPAQSQPGNGAEKSTAQLALLDFGSVGRLAKDTRSSLAAFLVAVKAEDNVAAADRLLEMLDVPESLDRRAFERDLGILLTYLGSSTSSLVMRLFRLVQQHELGIPAQLAAALRAIGALEGSIQLIEPGFNVIAEAQHQAAALLSKMYSPEAIKNLIASNTIGFVSALQRLPRNLSSLSEKIERGTLQVQIRQFSDPADRSFLTSLAHEGIVAAISIAAIIGSIVLLVSDGGPLIAPNLRLYPFFGYTLALGGFIFGLRSLVRAFRGRS